jgi:hypothetical protein
MTAVAALSPMPQPYRALSVAAVVHALVVLLLWLGVFYAHWDLIPGRWWLLLMWLWLIWPVLLTLHPARTLRRVAVPAALGAALLGPCLPTAYAFTTWVIGGFAP